MHAAEALDEASELETLEQVFRWAIRRDPPFMPADVVIHDEFTRDVIRVPTSVYGCSSRRHTSAAVTITLRPPIRRVRTYRRV